MNFDGSNVRTVTNILTLSPRYFAFIVYVTNIYVTRWSLTNAILLIFIFAEGVVLFEWNTQPCYERHLRSQFTFRSFSRPSSFHGKTVRGVLNDHPVSLRTIHPLIPLPFNVHHRDHWPILKWSVSNYRITYLNFVVFLGFIWGLILKQMNTSWVIDDKVNLLG